MDARNQWKTYSQALAKNPVNKISLKNIRKMKENIGIPSVWVEMGHHALALEAPLSLFGMEAWHVEKWRRGRVNGLRGKGYQGTHTGSIMIGREGVF